jgi:hypothetical protein
MLTGVSNLSIIFDRLQVSRHGCTVDHKPGRANPVQTNMNDVVLKASNCNGTKRL